MTLQVQEYLRSGKTLADLESELGIKSNPHPTDGRVILNYDQIESSKYKTHPIVRECRALVLEKDSWNLVARAFGRFFNYGENLEDTENFNWANATFSEKVDGSLLLLYFYNGKWHIGTRNSYGDGLVGDSGYTWRQIFDEAFGDYFYRLNPEITYVCELCAPQNKVVRYYKEPQVYLLTMFRGEKETSIEYESPFQYNWNGKGFKLPQRYSFKLIDDIQNFLEEQGKDDPTFEGVVLHDGNIRLKVKSLRYLSLHRLKGENDNLYSPKNLIKFILEGEEQEILVYFPEVREHFEYYGKIVAEEVAVLNTLWDTYKSIVDQKEFALSIIGKTKLTGVLFTARKNKTDPLTELKKNSDALLEILKGKSFVRNS